MIRKFLSGLSMYEAFLVFALGFLICALNIGGLSIYALDEAKNAECAREMLEQQEWVVPTFNYELRTDKPPLHYYFMILAYRILGVNELAARLFSALFGALTIWWTYRFARAFIGRPSARYSALILLSSLHFSLQFHMAVPDPYLVGWITLGCFSFYAAVNTRQVKYLWPTYLAMGLGTLTKGPIAIALPGLIFLVYLIQSRQLTLGTLRFLRPWIGVLLVLAVALPWYLLVHDATDGEWTEAFFLRHNVNRFSEPMEGHGGSFLLTFAYVLGGLLPFSLFLFPAVPTAWRLQDHASLVRFSMVAAACIVGFFAISSTKLPNYTVPAYPFLAIILGYFLSRPQQHPRWTRIIWPVYVLLMIGLPTGVYFGLGADPALMGFRHLALYFLLLPLAAGIAWYGYTVNRQGSFELIAGSWILTIVLFYFFAFPQIDRQNPVNQHLDLFAGGVPVAQYQRMNRAFLFYLQRPIASLESPEAVRAFFEQYPDGLVISRDRYLEELEGTLPFKVEVRQKDLFEKHTTVILSLEKSAKLR